MNADVVILAKTCVLCWCAKVLRRTVRQLGTFQYAGRFQLVHLDLIGYRVIHRPEPISLEDINSGVFHPLDIVFWHIDQNINRLRLPIWAQYFQMLIFLFRIDKKKHLPITHKLIVMLRDGTHHSFKTAFMAHLDTDRWLQIMPSVIFVLRSSFARTWVPVSPRDFMESLWDSPDSFSKKHQLIKNPALYLSNSNKICHSWIQQRVETFPCKTFQNKDLAICTYF